MIEIRPPERRFRTDQDGITTFHCFSAGVHYEPDNVAFGPVIGVDEHLVAPGAGFDWHGHRGVHIVSWVLEGVLRHEDDTGEERFVPPGVLLVQSTGDGIRHRETNASDVEPMRFVQIAILGSELPGMHVAPPPVAVAGCDVNVLHSNTIVGGQSSGAFALVTRGRFHHMGADLITPGASVRADDGDAGLISGEGELLIVTFERGLGPAA